MKKIMIAFGVVFMLSACATNPFTGKKTLSFVSNDQLFPMAFQQYSDFLNENKVIKGTNDAEAVRRVGQRIASAAEKWLNANGYPGYLKDYKWEYNLVQDDQVNAWCMPGGKIVVYTGLLPIAQGDTGLAVVMGHEVAHALANHGAQRMSAAQLQQIGAVAGNVALSKNPENQQLFNQAYAVGSQVGVMLPFSRSHETEADAIGLRIMAIAGYNPDEASKLWVRMKEKSGGQAPPEFLSTHPSNETRIQNLNAWAPAAKQEAAKFGVSKFQ